MKSKALELMYKLIAEGVDFADASWLVSQKLKCEQCDVERWYSQNEDEEYNKLKNN